MKALFVHQTKHQLRHNISRHVNFLNSSSWMGPLNDDNKLQVDEENKKNCKLKMYIINFMTNRYKLTASVASSI